MLSTAKLFLTNAYNFAEVVVYRLAAIDCRQAVIAILNKPNVYKAAGRFRGAECPQSSRAEAAPKPAASTIGVRAPRSSHPTKEGTPNLKPVADRQFQLNRKFNLRFKLSLRLCLKRLYRLHVVACA